MTDLEDRLARIMNETVDVRTGPRRRPPELVVPDRTRGRVRPWFIPLTVAAAVAAILLATFGISHAVTSHRRTEPAAPTPTVQLGAAQIALPTGWAVRTAPTPVLNVEQWCLAPEHTIVTTDPGGCPVLFTVLEDHATIDVDVPGGLVTGPSQCIQGNAGTLDKAEALTFGGRSAEYRRWTIDCSAAHPAPIPEAQYVAADYPGFILYSDRATAANLAALDFIAQHSTLPKQSGLRLQDRGITRSVSQRSDGAHITIQRIVVGLDAKTASTEKQTYSYVLPKTLLPFEPPKVGEQVNVLTDGRSVTGYSLVP